MFARLWFKMSVWLLLSGWLLSGWLLSGWLSVWSAGWCEPRQEISAITSPRPAAGRNQIKSITELRENWR